ncbi:prolyl aminopeptidase [Rhodobacter veldkampii DSM 11550]|uniref:Proline iminopeptidase n=1 Tax=Phaeovulum veldkampii DSM 11550 TaxID=1185920 RepID=A0A2T4JJC1_9RHOB|nr:prolyl aminopeptidase [Phaeovulum veldkampii]MBK5947200.1 prolyl aminopeptidase [Phaeovulum veldkampii DSM 11550]PTE17985.1 prolyl aminopeptidase [Phaeovulum veldkampii DSM 11550]TDQ60059.1 prolyl aminopeptidase [Phaeovulum veldkampii DSM 11550]
MDRTAGQKRAAHAFLYPPLEPFDQRMLEVGQGHRLYVEQSGHPQGAPVVVLHGGPGGGSNPAMRRYFDPAHYRIILFDQRGCGRSRPHASVEANTTPHLIADIEAIRETLGVRNWFVFGGSWGATLALLYAQAHPGRVRHLILRGVFLAMREELKWFYGGGAGLFFPDLWADFCRPIPEAERGDLIGAYHRRLFSGDWATEARHGRIWAQWENALASVDHDGPLGEAPPDYARAFARLENHYFKHDSFLDCDGQILRDRHRIEDIPASIVQGRMDMICPPISAWRLADGWTMADLRMVPAAGHALSEPGITAELVRVMNRLRE